MVNPIREKIKSKQEIFGVMVKDFVNPVILLTLGAIPIIQASRGTLARDIAEGCTTSWIKTPGSV